ncbi:RNA polymerase sigma factor [Sporosarcina sp. FSL W7-1349]|uniref:RNA polymerase sigma factor n=1 Tax=Sporosarcina sp. FSL W7-1349 TaxID=2921561 RepID=UPI0030FC78F9
MKEDKQLIKKVKQGSEAALEQLVSKYYEQIFHYSFRLLGSYEEASDATQDIFISMMKALSTYQERRKFKSWLFTIAYNRCMNSFRELKRSHLEMTVQQDDQGDGDFAERYVERKFVEDLVNTLPDIQKNALLLKYYHGLTAKEIAHITGVTTTTVKSRLYQGLQKLQKIVKDGE